MIVGDIGTMRNEFPEGIKHPAVPKRLRLDIFLAVVLVLLGGAFSSTAISEALPVNRVKPNELVKNRLRIREYPSLESRIVGYLFPGVITELSESQEDAGWLKVNFSGYVSKEYVNVSKGIAQASEFDLILEELRKHTNGFDRILEECLRKRQSNNCSSGKNNNGGDKPGEKDIESSKYSVVAAVAFSTWLLGLFFLWNIKRADVMMEFQKRFMDLKEGEPGGKDFWTLHHYQFTMWRMFLLRSKTYEFWISKIAENPKLHSVLNAQGSSIKDKYQDKVQSAWQTLQDSENTSTKENEVKEFLKILNEKQYSEPSLKDQWDDIRLSFSDDFVGFMDMVFEDKDKDNEGNMGQAAISAYAPWKEPKTLGFVVVAVLILIGVVGFPVYF